MSRSRDGGFMPSPVGQVPRSLGLGVNSNMQSPNTSSAGFFPENNIHRNSRRSTPPYPNDDTSINIAARLSDSCYVSDDESRRRTPVKASPSRSLSFSVGTTPCKHYPSRMSISPAASAGGNTPRRLPSTPTRTPSRTRSGRKTNKARSTSADPMSVCKGGRARGTSSTPSATTGKENGCTQHRFQFASPSRSNVNGNEGTATKKGGGGQNADEKVRSFDLMPPPMPRTPGAKGNTSLRSTIAAPVSPLQQHDPNQPRPVNSPARRGENGGEGGSVRGRTDSRAAMKPPLSPAASPRSRTFSLGSSNNLDCSSPRAGAGHSRTSSRGATAAAARCAPTPPRRGRSCSASGSSRTQHPTSGSVHIHVPSSIADAHRMAPPSSRAGRVGPAEVAPALSVEGGSGGSASGLKDLLVSRAREFAEQGTAEALVGLPREAVKSFSRALKIVPVGWSGVEELLLARAQLLFGLSKHQACAEDCRAALRLVPNTLQGVMLLGHACLRVGMHVEAARYLREGLSLAMSQSDPAVLTQAQSACRAGIEEASRVGSALESGARAAAHCQHEAASGAAMRVLEIAPQCTAAQDMRAAALLGVMRPAECVHFCEGACIRPRADPEDDADRPTDAVGCVSPVQAALGMSPGVARCYASALRGCGREQEAIPVLQALRCRDPSLAWCVEDTARWQVVGTLLEEGKRLATSGNHDAAVRSFTQVLESDSSCVVPSAEAFCHRGCSRLGQGSALEALDDCYRALSLLSVEGGEHAASGAFACARGMALLVRGRAYLGLSRLGEALSDLKGCLRCDPALEEEAMEYLRTAEQRQDAAGVQRRQCERQEKEREERRAKATAAAEAARAAEAKAKEKAKATEREAASADRRRAAGRSGAGRQGGAGDGASATRTPRRRENLSPFPKPETRSSRAGGKGGYAASGDSRFGAAGGGTPSCAGANDGMYTPAKGSKLARSPKIDSESYYRRLGLGKDASEAAIKKAYRKLALKYHPDKNKTDSAAQSFRLVSEAYRVLTSPDSKQQYDRTRRYTIETPPSNGGRGGGGASSAGSSRKGRGKGYSDNVRGYGNGGGYW